MNSNVIGCVGEMQFVNFTTSAYLATEKILISDHGRDDYVELKRELYSGGTWRLQWYQSLWEYFKHISENLAKRLEEFETQETIETVQTTAPQNRWKTSIRAK